jgi:hypothetical protein
MKSINTLPIEDFLDKARVAIRSNQKNLVLSLKEVSDLQNSLSMVMTRLAGNLDKQVSEKANDNITVTFNGGKF